MNAYILGAGALLCTVLVATLVSGDAEAPAPAPDAAPQTPDAWHDRLRRDRPRLPTTPAPGDWLAEHRERGQSVAAYERSDPVRPSARWTTLYILPIGTFDPAQRRVIEQTAAYMRAFFCLPVVVLPDHGTDDLPPDARRTTDALGTQLSTTYLLNDVLLPRRPDDAVALLGLTPVDLWPGEGWNFVYGQASLRHRVGVWSFARNGDLAAEPALYLQRTLKIAVHETSHMLGMQHCTAWACVMNGVNNRAESDRAPLSLCPEDMIKLAWNTGCDPVARIRALARLSADYGLPGRDEYRRMLDALD